MTRPSPRPRKEKAAELGVTSQKSASERITGQPDKPEPPKTQVTYSALKFVRSDTPIAFEAATFIKTGVDLAPADEQQSASGAK